MEIKKITQYKGVLKGLHFEEEVLIDENGEEINLNEIMKVCYEGKIFDLSTTAKEEEIIVPEENED